MEYGEKTMRKSTKMIPALVLLVAMICNLCSHTMEPIANGTVPIASQKSNTEVSGGKRRSTKPFHEDPIFGELYTALVDDENVRPTSIAMVHPYDWDVEKANTKQNVSYTVREKMMVRDVYKSLAQLEEMCVFVEDQEKARDEVFVEKEEALLVSHRVDRVSVYLLYGYYTFRISIYSSGYVTLSNENITVYYKTKEKLTDWKYMSFLAEAVTFNAIRHPDSPEYKGLQNIQ